MGVSLDGVEYLPVPLESQGFDVSGNGPTAQPTVVIGNVAQQVNDFINLLKTPGYRLEGARFTRRLIQGRYLDGGIEASAPIKGPPADIYTVEQLSSQNREAITLKLRTGFETEGVTLPGRLAMRTCSFEYRGDGCNYNGPLNNVPCPYTLEGCKQRFGQFAVLPLGGYPGLGAY